MANRKKEVYKPKPMTEGKRNLIQGLLQEYDIQSADDIQEVLMDLLSGTIQDRLETEMDKFAIEISRKIYNVNFESDKKGPNKELEENDEKSTMKEKNKERRKDHYGGRLETNRCKDKKNNETKRIFNRENVKRTIY